MQKSGSIQLSGFEEMLIARFFVSLLVMYAWVSLGEYLIRDEAVIYALKPGSSFEPGKPESERAAFEYFTERYSYRVANNAIIEMQSSGALTKYEDCIIADVHNWVCDDNEGEPSWVNYRMSGGNLAVLYANEDYYLEILPDLLQVEWDFSWGKFVRWRCKNLSAGERLEDRLNVVGLCPLSPLPSIFTPT